jgi:hypothetical protein
MQFSVPLCLLPFSCWPLQLRKARTNIQLAQSELEDQQKRAAHREARAADLQAQVCWGMGAWGIGGRIAGCLVGC